MFPMRALFRTGSFESIPVGREFTFEPHVACIFRKIDSERAELVSGMSFHLKRKGTKVKISKIIDCLVWRQCN